MNKAIIMFISSLLVMSTGLMYMSSIFVIPIEKTFGWSRVDTSIISSSTFLFFALAMFIGGYLLKHLKPHIVMMIGSFLILFGLMIASVSSTVYQYCLGYGVIASLGIGLFNIVPLTINMKIFPEKSGVINAILTTMGPLGGVFASFLCAYLLSNVDLILSLRIIAIIIFFYSIILNLLLYKIMNNGEFNNVTLTNNINIKKISIVNLFKSKFIIFLIIWACLEQAGAIMLIGHLSPISAKIGFDISVSAIALSIFSIGMGAGRFLFGFIIDKYNMKISSYINSFCLITGMILLILLFVYTNKYMLYISVFVIAIGGGGATPNRNVIVSKFVKQENLGVYLGFCAFTSIFLAGLIGNYTIGIIYTVSNDYLIPICYMLVLSMIALIINKKMNLLNKE